MPPFHRFNRLRRRVLGLVLTALAMLCVPGTQSLPILATLDASIHDSRTRLSTAQPDDRVLIVDIDEASMARIGRWPWDRSRVGELAATLVDKGGARVVGIDMVFAEPQREPGEDAAFARLLSGRPIVLGYYFTRAADARTGAVAAGGPLERTTGTLPAPVLRAQALTGLDLGVTAWSGFGANLALLQARAAGAGFINPLLDPDATVRALPLLAEFRGELYESFAVAVLRQWLGSASLRLDADHLSLQGARGSLALPLSDSLTALVPYAGRVADERGPARRFTYLSAADVLQGRVDWSRFKDRVVLLGTSAPGLADLRATPIHLALPGVEIHATLIAAALASITAPALLASAAYVFRPSLPFRRNSSISSPPLPKAWVMMSMASCSFAAFLTRSATVSSASLYDMACILALSKPFASRVLSRSPCPFRAWPSDLENRSSELSSSSKPMLAWTAPN